MICAIEVSQARGLLSVDLAERIIGTVRRISPQRPTLPRVDEAWRLMRHDKKVRSGRLIFVLLKGKGNPVWVDDVSQSELAEALRATQQTLFR
jgi:3-dehydroquinate synthetase